MPARRSPGQLDQGFVMVPVGFESELPHFKESVLKVYLVIRMRTVWLDHVALETPVLVNITRLSRDSVRAALRWLEDPSQRQGEAQQLPVYIRRQSESQHEHSNRKVQVIYVERWVHPRTYIAELKKMKAERDEKLFRRKIEQVDSDDAESPTNEAPAAQ